MTSQGFSKATSGNLPCVDMMMVGSFFTANEKFVGAEFKGVKNARAGRETYGDDAVGYVQVQRAGNECTVKARVTPEHRVRNQGYAVNVIINEVEETVVSANCEDCAASAGGCKHAIALLMWVYRRSEEPAPTSVSCYWKKSKLASVGTTLKFIKSNELAASTSKRCSSVGESDGNGEFLSEVLAYGKKYKCNSQLLKHYSEIDEYQYLSLNSLIFWFNESGGGDAKAFLSFCDFHMTDRRIEEAAEATVNQCNTSVWHNLRFGRVTASRIYEAAKCKTVDGSLTEAILGAKIPDSVHMERGRNLESRVLRQVENVTGKKFIKVGLILSADNPAIGASPDGICDECVVEVKCPASKKSVKSYVIDGKPSPKCLGQIQLQMHLSGRKVGLLCIADSDFEVSNKVEIISVKYDSSFIENLIKDAMHFWELAVFPKLGCAGRK